MPIQSTTLRPGLLVSLKTSLTGNVSYDKVVLETEHQIDGTATRARWETTKRTEDKAEQDRAEKARSKAASLIRAVCTHSAFGLLCPEADADKLAAAIAAAREVADRFNRSAALSRITVNVIAGRIAADDAEAVKAINSEVAELMARMTDGLRKMDVEAIRAAADKAKELGAMLPTETAARIQIAVDTARSAARQIVKAGEAAAREIDTAAIRRITEARTSFLDLEPAGDVQAPEAQGVAIDLEPSEEPAAAVMMAAAESAPQLDLI